MLRVIFLVSLITAFGLATAGVGTYLYQWLFKRDAALRFDGKTPLHAFGNLLMSFICGPVIMLHMGWRQEQGGAVSMSTAFTAACLALGWAFITGLLLLSVYLAVMH